MRKTTKALLPIAAAALPLALATPAQADGGEEYHATLNAINGSGGSGMMTLTLEGNQATVTESWTGLASTFKGAPYPHVQHAHIAGQGTCPTPSADKNGDGIVDTVEGQPAYGMIGTTFSVKGDTSPDAGTNVKIAPAGPSTDYQRTFTLSDDTVASLEDGTAVVVVHGLDPATLSKKAANAKSNLVPELPLAATAPALCGTLSTMPDGGPDTGAGSTAGFENAGMAAAGGGLIAVAGAAYFARKRQTTRIGRTR